MQGIDVNVGKLQILVHPDRKPRVCLRAEKQNRFIEMVQDILGKLSKIFMNSWMQNPLQEWCTYCILQIP